MGSLQRIISRPCVSLLKNSYQLLRGASTPRECPAPSSRPLPVALPTWARQLPREQCEPSTIRPVPLDLPTLLGRLSVIEEPPVPSAPPAKEARNDVKNRRKRMKKHQLRKFFRDYYIELRKMRVNRLAKKERELTDHFDWVRLRTEGWKPEQKVQEQLQLARRGGFFINILSSRGGLKDD